ncbi:MAG TPA: M61 family peptidase, partial [Thiomicrospira sp.]|nr:M61 family peptidase [Thiomicrospira sp.]
MITYSISAFDPNAHLIKISLKIDKPIQPVQTLRLPNWIPGSYLIRDFAKHLLDMNITNEQGKSVALNTIDKSNWSFTSS